MSKEREKELELLRKDIGLAERNQFEIKKWAIGVFTVFLIGKCINQDHMLYMFLCVMPIFLCWGLDAYYMQKKRKFQAIYTEILGWLKKEGKIEVKEFEVPLHNFYSMHYSYIAAAFAACVYVFYITMIFLVLVLCINM